MSGNSGNTKRLPDQVSTQKRKKKDNVVRYRITVTGIFEVNSAEMDRLSDIFDKAKNMYEIIPLFKDSGSVDVALEEIEELERSLI